MARKLKWDVWLFATTLVLVAVSILMVYSASEAIAARQGEENPFVAKQVLFAVLGLVSMFAAMHVDYTRYRNPRVILAVIALTVVALLAVLIVGPKINGTRRWFGVGGIGIQPSELAKLTLILAAAAFLEQRMRRIDEIRAIAPLLSLVLLLAALVMAQPDYGSAATLIAIVGVMMFAAGLPLKYLAGLGGLAAGVLAGLAVLEPYRLRRLLAFLDPWQDRFGDGFQVVQSIIAVGTGGVAGRGLGYSVQKLFYLPYPQTDFIFAVLSEELGLVGSTAIVACFAVIAWRGLRTALRAPDAFGSFLALGLTAMIAVQAFVNISVVLGMLPTKGITLPFVSAGGSSLLVSLAGMGVLLNISQHASATS
ncbi:MAG TPA: putative lipid II flippase FtsW [Vicinamibacterales bacterium]|nr:putative lipid II flippase FtsW [Vicinamibacterales bacterium]HPW20207.1 putative lipid II flippase FtsW [Vicinamibacterales bacterium]